MTRSLRFLAAALLAALALPALATNGMRMTGFGAVQNGMGGVGVGATLDSSAAVTNPAGLTELGRRLDVNVTYFAPSPEYKATSVPPPNPPFVNQDGATFETDRGPSFIPNIGVVLPLGAGFTAGVGAYGVGGMGVDYKTNLYNGSTLTSYQQLRLAPALAYKVSDALSFGVTLNAMWAQMEYDVASGFGQLPHDAANSFGVGATVGAKFTPVKDFTIGLAYETESYFQEFEFTIPAHPGADPLGNPVNFPGGVDTLKFNQPAVASIGAAWRVVPAFLLAVDVQLIEWSKTNGPNQPKFTNDTSLTGSMPFNLTWSDQVVYKVGVAVDATDALTIRAGYNYAENPLDPSRAFENIAFPAVAEHHVSLGLGWAFSDALAVNLAGTYSPKTTLKGSNPQQGLLSYETAMSQLSFDAGLAWKF
ncbi:MAG: outer membrane protein transport protein [Anaeromyxobacter sp.]|nr:outer membrane protein transport protein [Anaeromyxobacter sp.]